MNREKQEQLERIARMEQVLNAGNETVQDLDRALTAFLALQPRLKELEAYYTGGQWRRDYEDDEAGKLPADLPRGVLSQDGVYDLLAERDTLWERLRGLNRETAEPAGLALANDTELRDRIAKLVRRREETTPPETEREGYLQKLYDGALLVVAEAAKDMWPELDVQPLERSALYETFDEREQFMEKARQLIGAVTIDKPEDLTYYINKETLTERDAAR